MWRRHRRSIIETSTSSGTRETWWWIWGGGGGNCCWIIKIIYFVMWNGYMERRRWVWRITKGEQVWLLLLLLLMVNCSANVKYCFLKRTVRCWSKEWKLKAVAKRGCEKDTWWNLSMKYAGYVEAQNSHFPFSHLVGTTSTSTFPRNVSVENQGSMQLNWVAAPVGGATHSYIATAECELAYVAKLNKRIINLLNSHPAGKFHSVPLFMDYTTHTRVFPTGVGELPWMQMQNREMESAVQVGALQIIFISN